MNTPEYHIKRLLSLKIEIQELEEENNRNKETWRDLGQLIRHTSQTIAEKKKMLFEMI